MEREIDRWTGAVSAVMQALVVCCDGEKTKPKDKPLWVLIDLTGCEL